jgi:hypothetical protein
MTSYLLVTNSYVCIAAQTAVAVLESTCTHFVLRRTLEIRDVIDDE